MKKVLLIFFIVLLGILIYVIGFSNIYLGDWKNTNIDDLKEENNKLAMIIATAIEKNEQTYTNRVETLSKSIKELNKTKEEYDSKVKYITDETELGIVQIKEYKIEYLWTILENYAKDEKIKLKLDLIENESENLYNLDITLTGDYIGITDFIYDIEKDDSFDFKIENFKMVPQTVQITNNGNDSSNDNGTTQTTKTNTSVIQATFNINNVRIELD